MRMRLIVPDFFILVSKELLLVEHKTNWLDILLSELLFQSFRSVIYHKFRDLN